MSPRLLPVVAGTLLVACGGGSGATVPASALGLPPASGGAPALASTRVATSPDGGIYVNWDDLSVVLLTTTDATPIAGRLGGLAPTVTALRPLGRFTLVGVHLRNRGKVGSEPALDDLQVASDYAPDGTSSGPLRRLYHPTFPLAALSPQAIAGDCTVHLDPGQTATVLLLYPPLRTAASYLWGRFDGFSLELRPGGRAEDVDGDLHVAACTPPQPQ
ncbi:MAG TPA: hypothetical protein VMU20_02725 [Candidatus Dormibacteraeota bacterium]|nr:hypothetical protein [Candidatus Dormibacteraeota bacterium]